MRLALLALLTLPVAAPAAEPTLELRAATGADLLAAARFVTDFVGGRETVAAAAEVLGAKGHGLDPSRPWGLTVTMTADVIDSPLIVVAPLADEAAFRKAIGGEAKELVGGVTEVSLPGVPVPVYFKAAGDTLYLSAVNAKSLDAANLPDPARFFAGKLPHRVVGTLHYQRVPADVRTVVFAEWELQANDGMRRARRGETPAETKLRQWLLGQTLPLLKAIFDDGDTWTVTFDRDPATGDTAVSATLAAKPDTPLARGVAALKNRPGRTLPPMAGDNLLAATAKVGLPDAAKPGFPAVVDALLAEAVASLPAAQQFLAKLAAEPLLPTLRAGDIDMAVGVATGSASGGVRLLADAVVVNGDDLARTFKSLASFVPKATAAVAFDVQSVGGVKVHTVTLKGKPAQTLLGGPNVNLGTGPDRLLVVAEPTGKLVLAAAEAKPNPDAPLLDLIARPAALAKAFAPDAGTTLDNDSLKLRVTGGETLTIVFTVSGPTLAFLQAAAGR